MNRSLVFVLALAGAGAALGQGTQPAAGGAPRHIVLAARALDYSTMLRQNHGNQREGQPPPALTPVALGDASVMVLARGLPGEPRKVPARTDSSGAFTADLGDLPTGAVIELLADRGAGEKFYARSLEVGPAALPADVQFYRVAQSPAGIVQQVTQVVTMKEEKNDKGGLVGRTVLVRQFIDVGNFGFEVWLGDVTQDKPVSYWMPVPDGFELLAGGITVDNRGHDATPEAMPHGGRGVAWRQPLFPALGQDAHHFMTVLSRPYVEGESFDLGMHVEYPTEMFSMNLQEGTFAYVMDDGGEAKVQLRDGGARPGMGQSQKVTHAWMGEDIRAHSTINGRVIAGKPPLDKAVLVVVGCIAFVVVGGIVFGFRFGKRGQPAATPRDPVATALAELDERRRRGEITSVDYAARRALLLGPGAAAAATPAVPPPVPTAAPAAGPRDLLAQVETIAARATSGSEPQLAEDVRTLARAVRELMSQGRGAAGRG